MPQPSTLRTISRNAISSWTAFAVHVAWALLLTPYIVSSLGPARYSIWALITGLTGYYGLFDLGFRAGMTQYLTRYLATKDFVKMNTTASTGFVAMSCCGCLVATASLLVAYLAPIVFRIPADLAVETQWCILIIGVSTAVSFLFHPFAAVFPATQRFEVANGVVIITRLLSAAATITALRLGYGLVTLSIISAGVNLLQYSSLWRLAYYVLPELVILPRLARRDDFWPIVRYGVWSFFINGANTLKSRADIILIGVFLPIEAIAPFALALSMAEYIDRVFIPIGSVFFPVVTDLDSRGEGSRLKTVYLTGTKIFLLLAIAVGVLSTIWVTDFFRLWIDVDVTSNGEYPSPATLFCVLVVSSVCTGSQRIGQQVCKGTRRLKLLAAIVTCETTLKIVFSVVLVQRFGLIGVAFGTLLPAVIFQLFVLPANVNRILGIKFSDYISITWTRPILMVVSLVLLLLPIFFVVPNATSWSQLFIFATLSGILLCIPLFLIGLNRAERRRFVLEPAFQFGRRVRRRYSPQRSRS